MEAHEGEKTYTFKEICNETGLSKSTIVRWEKNRVFPKPRRRARNKARIFTEEHLRTIIEYRDRVIEEEVPTPPPPKGLPAKRPKRSKSTQ